MSRLLDRILTSCQRFRLSMLDEEAHVAKVLDGLRQKMGPNLPRDLETRVRANPHEGVPVGTKDAPLSELAGIPVIAADDVGAYVHALEEGTQMADVVASM